MNMVALAIDTTHQRIAKTHKYLIRCEILAILSSDTLWFRHLLELSVYYLIDPNLRIDQVTVARKA